MHLDHFEQATSSALFFRTPSAGDKPALGVRLQLAGNYGAMAVITVPELLGPNVIVAAGTVNVCGVLTTLTV